MWIELVKGHGGVEGGYMRISGPHIGVFCESGTLTEHEESNLGWQRCD